MLYAIFPKLFYILYDFDKNTSDILEPDKY
jgi:hypothetical protein